MITVQEAKKIIAQNTKALSPKSSPIENAFGKIVAADIYARFDIPAFPQSSMDGYAFIFDDWSIGKPLTIAGESAAGSHQLMRCLPGQAIRIFTGAPVPENADTVIMQEKATIENGLLFIEDNKLQKGNSVRAKGSEIKAGDLAFAKDNILTPAALAFLAGMGCSEVMIYPSPSVGIILTGNELQQPGQPLQYGQVYESNSYSLRAALKNLNVQQIAIYYAEDNLATLTSILANALEENDVVLLTGGISVGDYDFVLKAADNCDVSTLFHKIKQRPGKPLFFGKKDDKIIFGLPGNPSSVLTCFYEYVMPALGKLTNKDLDVKSLHVPLAKSFTKVAGLTQFLKAHYDGHTVTPLHAQESYRMHSFANANCFIVAPEEQTVFDAGINVDIHLLPF